MDERTKSLALAGVTLFACLFLFLPTFNLNNPFAGRDPHQSRASPSFLHRFVAVQLVYFSVVIAVRECLVIDITKPIELLDINTLQIVSFFGSQFKYGVFCIVVGMLALDFEGASLSGLILIGKGLYLLFPTVMDKINNGVSFNSTGEMYEDMRRQAIEQFASNGDEMPPPRIPRPQVNIDEQ